MQARHFVRVASRKSQLASHNVETAVRQLWATNRPLTAVGIIMAVAAVASLIGILVDPRIITGAPAWLKPFKFAVSTSIYSLTLAWIFRYLPGWPRMRSVVGWMTALIFVAEVAIIDLQAWRGTTSHFNITTPLNAALFATMGIAIAVQTLVSVTVAVALWRQSFVNQALGWAFRLGMIITIVGASFGGLMTRPTQAQLADARITHRMPIAGAHTVGGPDGGRGLPTTGWSLEHGDVRIPHFLGLHALQILPLVALALGRRRMSNDRRARLVLLSAGSYASFVGILLWQALRGQPLVAPDGATLAALAIWLGATVVGAGVLLGSRGNASHSRASWTTV